MQALKASPGRRPLGSNVYALRLLYKPAVRRQLAFIVLAICALDYLYQGFTEYAGLHLKLLKFDFEQFRRAAMDLDAGRNLYQFFLDLKCTSWCLGGYIYTPLVAELIRPLDLFSERVAAGIWIAATHVLFLLALGLLVWTLRQDLSTAALAFLVAAALVFHPFFDNLSYLQIGTLILLVMTGAGVLYLRARTFSTWWSGVLLGVATVIKVTPVLAAPALLPPGWFRAHGEQQRRALTEAAAGIAGVLIACVVLIGGMLLLVPYTDQFFTQVLPRISGGALIWENKSLASFVGLGLQLLGLPASSSPVTLVGVVALVGLVAGLSAFAAPHLADNRAVRAAVFASYIAVMPVVSSITWHHHLVVSLLAIFLIAPSLWPKGGGPGVSRAARWLVVASYALMFVDEIGIEPFTLGRGVVNTTALDWFRVYALEGANLWGMLLLWVATVLVLRAAVQGRSPEPSSSTMAGAERSQPLSPAAAG